MIDDMQLRHLTINWPVKHDKNVKYMKQFHDEQY
jgi:hypothetical protein